MCAPALIVFSTQCHRPLDPPPPRCYSDAAAAATVGNAAHVRTHRFLPLFPSPSLPENPAREMHDEMMKNVPARMYVVQVLH